MEKIKETDKYTVIKKRSGRYGVLAKNGKWINGEEKSKILGAEGLITPPKQKTPPAEEPVAEEAPTE